MMSEGMSGKERGLKFHWSNPKFAGLPWPCDKNKVRPKRRKCVKKPFSLAEARIETARLRKECPGARWEFKFCAVCQGFHVHRVSRDHTQPREREE